MRESWGRHDQPEEAVARILAAAEELYLRQGVEATTMLDVAAAAGCSRATLYLYFPNKQELRTALRNRAAVEIAAETVDRVAGIADPVARVAEGILLAVARVRATPALMMWFEPGHVGRTIELAQSSEMIASLAAAFTGDAGAVDPEDAGLRARLMIRVIVSLLTAPGTDAAEERALVERVVAPMLIAPAVR